MSLVCSDTSTPTEGRNIALTDFPNELLDIIITSLHSDELLLIARSCARLNDIALRFFFRSVDFHPENPESSLNIGVHPKQPFTILKGIRLSLTLRPLHTLRCQFSVTSLIEEIEEVLELLTLLPTVSNVHLIFPHHPLSPSGLPLPMVSCLWNSETDPRWLTFSQALLSFLNALHTKGCTHLEIIGLTPPMSLPVAGRRIALRPANTLREVILLTRHTLHGRLLHWIVQSINASPVQKLNLTTYYRWDLTAPSILSRVNLPHLKHFHLCTDQINDVIPCLRRNPNLTSLRVVWHFKPNLGDKVEICSLPYLTHLAGRPKFVISFLSLPSCFPVLHTVHLLMAGVSSSPEEPPYYFNNEELSQTFSTLRSCPTIRSLSLSMGHRAMAKWMVNIGNSVSTQSQNAENPFVLGKVVNLAVYQAVGLLPDFPRWLSVIFPNLNSLVFDELGAHDGRAIFLRHLKAMCPTLREVSFSKNASPKTMAQWLEPKILLQE